MAKLEATSDKTIQEQLKELLSQHQVKMIDLFRDWDDNGDGAIDKKEMRRAVAALGYECSKKEIDKFFESIDDDDNGFIEFQELKEALSSRPVPKRKF